MSSLETSLEDSGDDGEAERSRLTRTGLCARHQISTSKRRRNGILLHRRRVLELTSLHVRVHARPEVEFFKRADRRRHVSSTRLYRNIFVQIKIQTGVFTREKLRRLRVRIISRRRSLLSLLLGERVVLASKPRATGVPPSTAESAIFSASERRSAVILTARESTATAAAPSSAASVSAAVPAAAPCDAYAPRASRQSPRFVLRLVVSFTLPFTPTPPWSLRSLPFRSLPFRSSEGLHPTREDARSPAEMTSSRPIARPASRARVRSLASRADERTKFHAFESPPIASSSSVVAFAFTFAFAFAFATPLPGRLDAPPNDPPPPLDGAFPPAGRLRRCGGTYPDVAAGAGAVVVVARVAPPVALAPAPPVALAPAPAPALAPPPLGGGGRSALSGGRSVESAQSLIDSFARAFVRTLVDRSVVDVCRRSRRVAPSSSPSRARDLRPDGWMRAFRAVGSIGSIGSSRSTRIGFRSVG